MRILIIAAMLAACSAKETATEAAVNTDEANTAEVEQRENTTTLTGTTIPGEDNTTTTKINTDSVEDDEFSNNNVETFEVSDDEEFTEED